MISIELKTKELNNNINNKPTAFRKTRNSMKMNESDLNENNIKLLNKKRIKTPCKTNNIIKSESFDKEENKYNTNCKTDNSLSLKEVHGNVTYNNTPSQKTNIKKYYTKIHKKKVFYSNKT